MLRGFIQTVDLRQFGFWIMGLGFTQIGPRTAVGHIQVGVCGVHARMGNGLILGDVEKYHGLITTVVMDKLYR